jgi:hypothetical protein
MHGFSKPIQLVGDRKQRVAQQHPWTSVTHDFTSLGSSRWFVAMNRAVGAGWLVVAIRAFLKTTAGVVEKLSTACAKIIGRRIVMVGAVNADHLHHRHLLSGKVFFLRLHADPDSGVQVQSNKRRSMAR